MAHIVVVEDDTDLNDVLSYNLQRRGHDVKPTFDGEEALHELRKSPPDLVLLDLMLPRADGWEVCQGMANDASLARVPVVFFTALGAPEEYERARHIPNFAGYFVKPYATNDVLRHLDKLLTTQPPGKS